jgi:hypothetical protein
MAFVGIVQGIDFHSISGNAENMQVYKDRNMKAFRPHLHYDWNDYVMGPIEAMRETSIESGDEAFNYSDALLICFFFERLIEIKPEIRKILFIEKDRILTNKNGKRSTPITFNSKTKMFSYYNEGLILDENDTEKFYVKKIAKSVDGISLGKLTENLEFENAVKELNKEEKFSECFENFITVIKEHKAELSKQINSKVNDAVSQEISDTKMKLDKVLERMISKKASISEKDQEFIKQFSDRTKELIDGLLEINLEM